MITSVHINQFKCFKSFDIELDKLTVLIGPNDSGKTSFLESLRLASAVCASPENKLSASDLNNILDFRVGIPSVWRMSQAGRTTIGIVGDVSDSGEKIALSTRSINRMGEDYIYWIHEEEFNEKGEINWEYGSKSIPDEKLSDGLLKWFVSRFNRVEYFSFSPKSLKKASNQQEGRRSVLSSEGLEFSEVLWDLSRDELEIFRSINKAFCERHPEYKQIGLEYRSSDGVTLNLHTKWGVSIPLIEASDGAALTLAFLFIRYWPYPPNMLLIEEPENGLHHSKIKDIIQLLRDLSDEKGTQVILTTHSPYLLDLVEPEEVRVFQKDDEGAVHAVKLSDFPEVEEMRKHFGAGEIWTAFDEKKIVETVRGEK